MKNIRYLVPNFFTSLSLLSALYAIVLVSNNEFLLPAWLIIFSMLCDFLDGKSARILNAMSDFGKLFDTMSDFVAFGLTPAFLVYRISLNRISPWGEAIATLFVFCGCYRLIRFTIRQKQRSNSIMNNSTPDSNAKVFKTTPKKESFLGLPIPMAAGLISLGTITNLKIYNSVPNEFVVAAIVFTLSVLMVSRIEYLAFEEESKYWIWVKILAGVFFMSIILTFKKAYLTFFVWNSLYIAFGLYRYLAKAIVSQKKQ